MNIVLLSGGSGKRLWPLSNDIRSKQFIKIFKREDGVYESMVQRVYRQIKEADPQAEVTIATSKTQVSAIHNQLGDAVGISVEPARRDTFPAIALATAYLRDVRGVSEEEAVVVCPVDPYVNEDYFEAICRLGRQAEKERPTWCSWGLLPPIPARNTAILFRMTWERSAQSKTLKRSLTRRRPGAILPKELCGTAASLHIS